MNAEEQKDMGTGMLCSSKARDRVILARHTALQYYRQAVQLVPDIEQRIAGQEQGNYTCLQ